MAANEGTVHQLINGENVCGCISNVFPRLPAIHSHGKSAFDHGDARR